MFKLIRKMAYRFHQFIVDSTMAKRSGAASQLLLMMTYKSMLNSGGSMPNISEVGFKVYSQSDEDGILLYIFSLIGTTSKKCVEICAGNGIECNTANLIINHGWFGLLVDGNSSLVEQGQEFYRRHQSTYVYPPPFVCAWITRENVNTIIRDNGFEGEIDLLSIDIMGVDYWIWEAISVVNPRVVIVDYQDIIGPKKALTVPYEED